MGWEIEGIVMGQVGLQGSVNAPDALSTIHLWERHKGLMTWQMVMPCLPWGKYWLCASGLQAVLIRMDSPQGHW